MTDIKSTAALADELERLASKASHGPWEADTANTDGDYGSGPDVRTGFHASVMYDGNGKVIFDALNAESAEVVEEYDQNDIGHARDIISERNFALLQALQNNLPAILSALRALPDQDQQDTAMAMALAEIRQIIGVDEKPMLSELPDLVSAAVKREWLPIESAPKDGSQILVAAFHDDLCGSVYQEGSTDLVRWIETSKRADDGADVNWVARGTRLRSSKSFSPTHWRPLNDPAPPQAEGEGE